MKTTLPERSLGIKPLLDQATSEILTAGKNTIAKIILFGSYARGDWVRNEYTEKNVTYSYQSDIGIMVVLKKAKYINHSSPRIEKRLKNKGMLDHFSKNPAIGLVFTSIDYVNKELRKGCYFYSVIKKEGILLYDSGEFDFEETSELPWEEKKEIAQEDFKLWFLKGSEFLIAALNAFHKNSFNQGAFYLHQATESFYRSIMLVSLGYQIKLHDIRKLGSITGNYHGELWQVFPCSSVDEWETFKMLNKAYIEARYDREYEISREQLLFLIGRVNYLQNMTKRICEEYLQASFSNGFKNML
jgi:predicted nucleotidyltransferase/HEPN domain-containing protein